MIIRGGVARVVQAQHTTGNMEGHRYWLYRPEEHSPPRSAALRASSLYTRVVAKF